MVSTDYNTLIKISRTDLDLEDIKKYRLLKHIGTSRIDGYPMFMLDKRLSSIRRVKIEAILHKTKYYDIQHIVNKYLQYISIVSIMEDHI